VITSKLPDIGTTIFSVMTALANEVGAVNCSQGFPDYPIDPVLGETLREVVLEHTHQYAPMPGLLDLRQRVSEKYRVVFETEVDPDREVTITSGGTAALSCAIGAVVRPGDEVIVFEPNYDSYGPAVRLFGGVVRASPLSVPDYRPQWDHVRSLISDRTALIIINSPHNPSGSVLSREDLDELADIVRGTRIVVVSDEVYELITFDGVQHHTVTSHPELRDRSFVITSFGKTFHATGWKVGACVSSHELMVEFRKVHQFFNFSVNTPAQVALSRYMSEPTRYTGLSALFQEKRDYLRSELEGSAWSLRPCTGSYFQLLGYEGFSDEHDVALATRLTREIGVALIPLSPFASGGVWGDRALRCCFAKSESTLREATQRLRMV
jgi:methionine aminotransferase